MGEKYDSHGCNGGSSFEAFEYLTQAGQELESVYPYASADSGEATSCTYSSTEGKVGCPVDNYMIWTWCGNPMVEDCAKY